MKYLGVIFHYFTVHNLNFLSVVTHLNGKPKKFIYPKTFAGSLLYLLTN